MSDVPSSATSTPTTSPSPSVSSSAPSTSAPTPSAPSQGTASSMSDIASKQLNNNNPTEAKPAVEAAKQEAIKEEIRKHKLKINGREVELDEPEVIRRAQMSESADQRYKEAATMKKQAEQFFEALLNDPKSVLTHPEIAKKLNIREFAEEMLSAELKRELMDPVERELEDLREFKRKQEEDITNRTKKEQETAQQARAREAQQKAAKTFDTDITQALAQTNLPKTAYTVKRVAEILLGARKNNYAMDVATAVDMVKEGYQTDLHAMVGGLDPEMMIKMFGDDLVKKLRKHDLAQLKSKLSPQQSPAVQANPTSAPQKRNDSESTAMKHSEWLETIRRKAGV